MRRRFFNSISKEETFTAFEVTNELVETMNLRNLSQDYDQAIGTVIMFDYESSKFRAFIFDDMTLNASGMGASAELKEFPSKQFLPFGIFLYGRRAMNAIDVTTTTDAPRFNKESITCVSLLTYNGSDKFVLIDTETAAYWGEMYRQNFFPSSIAVYKNRDTSAGTRISTKNFPLSNNANNTTLESADRQNISYGYGVFQTSDFLKAYSYDLQNSYNFGSYDNPIIDIYDLTTIEGVIANNGYTGYMNNFEAMYSPFTMRGVNASIPTHWCCPNINTDTFFYSSNTAAATKRTLEQTLRTANMRELSNTSTLFKTMVTSFRNQFLFTDIYMFRIPTFHELRMLFARLGHITEVEEILKEQKLITTPIAELFNNGANGLGGVILSGAAYETSSFITGIQGLSARFVAVSVLAVPPVNTYNIPFFRLTADMFKTQ